MKIWVNGCFDVLHTGHIDLLNFAKDYEVNWNNNHNFYNEVIVGIDSDKRVKQLKGNNRPINGEFDRAKMLLNLEMIDFVTIFNTDDELRNKISEHNIDYIIVGDHYKDREVIGAENSKYGVIYYPTDSRSTTNIIEKIKNL